MKKETKQQKQRKTFRFNSDELDHINGMPNPSDYVRRLVQDDMKKAANNE